MLIVKGNAIHMAEAGHFDVFVHGCNCMNIMGAGIARQVRSIWPSAFAADEKYSTGRRSMLGTYSFTVVRASKNNEKLLAVVNAYTQYAPGNGEDVFEYEAFVNVLQKLHEDFPDAIIGMPAIGCGYAGGDKERILNIIRQSQACDKIIFVEFG